MFGNACILTRIRDKSTYAPRYEAYAWGVPAVIVGICAIIDFSGVFHTIRIGYGSNNLDTANSTASPNSGDVSLNMSEVE